MKLAAAFVATFAFVPAALAQPSNAQPVVPGRQVPIVAGGTSGVKFIPSFQSGTPNQVAFTCTASSVTVSLATTATLFETFQSAASNTGSIYLSFNGPATTGSPSFMLQPGTSLNYSPSTGFLPTTVQASCSASMTLIVITQ